MVNTNVCYRVSINVELFFAPSMVKEIVHGGVKRIKHNVELQALPFIVTKRIFMYSKIGIMDQESDLNV